MITLIDINDLMVGLFGVPKKYKDNFDGYKGNYPLIQKWANEYPVEFIYQVVSSLVEGQANYKRKIGIGLIPYMLKKELCNYIPGKQAEAADERETAKTDDVTPEDIIDVKKLFGKGIK